MSTTIFTDHYDVLGASRQGSIKEIEIAWRKFALKHHPDKSRGAKTATEMFQKGQEAIEILRDPDRRFEYDKVLEAYYFHPQASSTGWNHHPPQTSSAYPPVDESALSSQELDEAPEPSDQSQLW